MRLEAIQEDQRILSCYCTAKLKLVAHPVGIVNDNGHNGASNHSLWGLRLYFSTQGFSI